MKSEKMEPAASKDQPERRVLIFGCMASPCQKKTYLTYLDLGIPGENSEMR